MVTYLYVMSNECETSSPFREMISIQQGGLVLLDLGVLNDLALALWPSELGQAAEAAILFPSDVLPR